MNIDITKPYQTCDGRKVRILCTDAPGDFQVVGYLIGAAKTGIQLACWTINGTYHLSPGNVLDLIPIPEHHVKWVNIDPDYNGSFLYATKEEADKSAGSQRTFCAKVEWDS